MVIVFTVIGIFTILVLLRISIKFLKSYRLSRSSKMSIKESLDLAGIPVITFVSNGTKINLLLDTGSNVSYLDKGIISNLEYRDIGEIDSVIGIDGNDREGSYCEASVSYRNYEFIEKFCVIDLSDAFRTVKEQTGVSIHGILGSYFFQKYSYILDFKELSFYMK